MIDTDALRKKIIDLAIQGKLTEHLPTDGDAKSLYTQIQAEKTRQIKAGQLRKTRGFSEINEKTIPYVFPKEWVVCYIDDIAFVTKLAGFEYTKYIADSMCEEGIPLFKGKNIQKGELVLEFESYIPERVSDELPRSKVNKKCLLTPYVGTIGNIALFDGSFVAHLGSNVGKIEILNPDVTCLKEEYLLYYLRSSIGFSELTKHRKATAQDSISIDAIRNVIVAIPPIEQQERIIKLIDDVLRILADIDTLQQQYESDLSILKNKIIDAGIRGKLTEQLPEDGDAENLYSQIKEEKAKLIKEGKIKKEKPLPEIDADEIPFEIPTNWKWVRLQGLVSILGDGIHGTPKYDEKGKYFFVNGNNLCDGRITIKSSTKRINEDEYHKYKKELNENTVFISINGTLGNLAFYNNEQVILGKSACYFNLLDKELKEYIYYVLKSEYYLKYANYSATGVTIKNVSLKAMNEFCIPLPPLAEQKRIASQIKKILQEL